MPSKAFGGFEPAFKSSQRQITTPGAITVTEAPKLYTTTTSSGVSTSTSLPFLDVTYDYGNDYLYEDYADYYNEEIKQKRAKHKSQIPRQTVSLSTNNINARSPSTSKSVNGQTSASVSDGYSSSKYYPPSEIPPLSGQMVHPKNKEYPDDEYEYYYEYVYEDELDDYLDDPLPTNQPYPTASIAQTTSKSAKRTTSVPFTTTTKPRTTVQEAPRRVWTAPTRRPTRRTSSATTSCLLYTSPSPRDATLSRMPSSA